MKLTVDEWKTYLYSWNGGFGEDKSIDVILEYEPSWQEYYKCIREGCVYPLSPGYMQFRWYQGSFYRIHRRHRIGAEDRLPKWDWKEPYTEDEFLEMLARDDWRVYVESYKSLYHEYRNDKFQYYIGNDDLIKDWFRNLILNEPPLQYDWG